MWTILFSWGWRFGRWFFKRSASQLPSPVTNNIATLTKKAVYPKRKIVSLPIFQPSIFRREMFVSEKVRLVVNPTWCTSVCFCTFRWWSPAVFLLSIHGHVRLFWKDFPWSPGHEMGNTTTSLMQMDWLKMCFFFVLGGGPVWNWLVNGF